MLPRAHESPTSLRRQRSRFPEGAKLRGREGHHSCPGRKANDETQEPDALLTTIAKAPGMGRMSRLLDLFAHKVLQPKVARLRNSGMVTGLQPWKAEFWHGSRKIVTARFGKLERVLESTRRRPCDCQSPPARYHSSRPDRNQSWALVSRFQAVRRARFGRPAADRLHRSYRPSALSYLSIAVPR